MLNSANKPANRNTQDKKICFIMCSNNEAYMNEAIFYINQLYIPEGYEIDFLSVSDALSMTSGYNEAMNASDAKYKVYLHQDTFLINPHFIEEFLDIFINNPDVGMIGCFGPKTMPKDGCMWNGTRFGLLLESHVYETKLLKVDIPSDMLEGNSETKYTSVAAIDGFLMITQYDIPWRDDIFTKWDFYDASQSIEFIQAGYKVVIPALSSPWALHDCGFLNMASYDEERTKYLDVYSTYLDALYTGNESEPQDYKYTPEEYTDELPILVSELKNEINQMLEGLNSNTLVDFINTKGALAKHDSSLSIAWYLSFVVKKELTTCNPTVYEKCHSLASLTERYRTLKFLVFRDKYIDNYSQEELIQFISTQNVSEYELKGIIDACTPLLK